MDFKELEYVITIAQERNISKAAERLFISQPVLSRFLQKLEDELGISLFERKKRQYIPTYAGELYLDMAKEILNRKEKFEQEISRVKKSQAGAIRVGITPGRGRTLLPKVLPDFHRNFPNFELNIFEEDVSTLERYLHDGTIDIAFFTTVKKIPESYGGFRYEVLSKEEIVLCTSKNNAFSILAQEKPDRRYPWIDLKKLENECFILLKENMRLGQLAKEILRENRMHPETMALNSIDTALALVGQQYGVAFSSSFRIEEHACAKDINIFSFGDTALDWDFVAAYREDFEKTRPVEYLMELIQQLDQ
mgnify:FL=1